MPARIPIFDYTVTRSSSGKLLAVDVFKCTERLKEFYENPRAATCPSIAMGGPQTVPLREINLAARARGEYPHRNWGSTLNGKVQPVSSFGDDSLHNGEVMPVHCSYEVFNAHVDQEAHSGLVGTTGVTGTTTASEAAKLTSSSFSSSSSVIEVMGSDGLYDVLSLSAIAEAVGEGCRNALAYCVSSDTAATATDTDTDTVRSEDAMVRTTSSFVLDAVWAKMMDVVDGLPAHDPFQCRNDVDFGGLGMKDAVPTWDDVSLWVLETTLPSVACSGTSTRDELFEEVD